MAQNYECVLLMDPGLSDEKVQEYVDQFSKIITDDNGEVVHVQKWGRRKLEYSIGGHPEACFAVLHFRSETPAGNVINEIERRVRINDDLLRELTVKVPELRVMDQPPLGPRATGITPAPHRGTPPRQGMSSRGGGRRPDRGGPPRESSSGDSASGSEDRNKKDGDEEESES